MDNLSQSIITLDVHFADKEDRLRHAWDTVHAKLVDGQKPTTNSTMVPCPWESTVSKLAKGFEAPGLAINSDSDRHWSELFPKEEGTSCA